MLFHIGIHLFLLITLTIQNPHHNNGISTSGSIIAPLYSLVHVEKALNVCWDHMVLIERCGRCPVEVNYVHPVQKGYSRVFYGVLVTYCQEDGTECTFNEEYPGGGVCGPEPYFSSHCYSSSVLTKGGKK